MSKSMRATILRSFAVSVVLLMPFSLAVSVSYAAEKKGDAAGSGRFLKLDVDSAVTAILRNSGTDGIKGIWKASADGASVAILPASAWERLSGTPLPSDRYTLAERFVIVLLDSPSPRLQPGTLMGWAEPAAKPGLYKAEIYTRAKGSRLTSPKKFVLSLADDGHITMRAIHKGLVINPWRFLPYMIRGSVRFRDDTPADLDGFFRIWPEPINPQNPRYL